MPDAARTSRPDLPPFQRPWPAVLWCLRHDRWLSAAIAVVMLWWLLELLPVLDPESRLLLTRRVGYSLFLAMTLAAVGRAGLRLERGPERRFWSLIGCALTAWLMVALGVRWADLLAPISPADVAADLGFAAFYGLFIVAVETRPHRRADRRTRRLERALLAPAAAFFVVGWLVYFPIVQVAIGAESKVPSLLFYSLLDAFLAARLFQLGRRSPHRWQAIYGALGAALLCLLASDLLSLARYAYGWQRTEPTHLAWNLAFLTFMAAPRLAGLPFSHAAPSSADPADPIARPLPTLLWALSFPVLHGALSRWPVLTSTGREPRELVVVVMVAGLGAYALFQRSLLVRSSLELWRQQRDIEQKIKTSEQDLRLILQRQRQHAELERSEKIFAKAFQASPDGLVLAAWEDGRILEVNSAFADLMSPAEELVGRRLGDLGLWPDPATRDRILEAVVQTGSVRDRRMSIDSHGGRRHHLLMSFESVGVDGERLLLVIAHRDDSGDRAFAAPTGTDHRGLTDALMHAGDRVSVTLADGRGTLLNRRAERHREGPPKRHREGSPKRHREGSPKRHREGSPKRHREGPPGAGAESWSLGGPAGELHLVVDRESS